jgi:tetratricopeptide (TPR) repeat protein
MMPRHSRRGLISAALMVGMGLGLSAFAQVEAPTVSQPPAPPKVSPPSPTASLEQLDAQGDVLRQDKMYLDALDYYEEALKRLPSREAALHNKIGITNLQMGKLDEAKRGFKDALKADKTFSEAHNNLGVLYYMQKKYGDAVKEYEKAIEIRQSASFYANLGNAQFARKEFEKAGLAFQQALALDPRILDRRSNLPGSSAQLPAPEDQAAFSFVLAKIYSKQGDLDRALQHLRRAMEDGYKDIGQVYDEPDFAPLRKDPRFAQLMAAKPAVIK